MTKDELVEIRPGVWKKTLSNGIEYTEYDTRQIIKDRRKKLHMTMEQLANAIGADKSTISRIESGIVEKLDSDKLFKIADALHCSPLYLTGEIDTPYPENMDDDFANRLYAAYMDADEKTKSIVRQLLDLAKMKRKSKLHFTLYGLRHLFATDLLREGINPKVIQTLMGHENADMTLYYAYTSEDERTEAVTNRKPS